MKVEEMKQRVTDLSRIHERNATMSLELKADSGYASKETHRVSADQWSRIVAISNEEPST